MVTDPVVTCPVTVFDAQLINNSLGGANAWQTSKVVSPLHHLSLELQIRHLEQLRDRSIVLVIDDSISMLEHWDALTELLGHFAHAIKEFDDDGLKYVFMSDGLVRNATKAEPIVNDTSLKKSKCTTQTNPSTTLSSLFEGYLVRYQNSLLGGKSSFGTSLLKPGSSKPCKPRTFYIFTDAVWQPHCRVSEPIVGLLSRLADAPQRQIGISFIQFGHDARGSRRLQFLANGLKNKYKVPDVVDSEPHEGNALKMILGSVNSWWDGDASDEDWLDD